jgi:hypothetical protein
MQLDARSQPPDDIAGDVTALRLGWSRRAFAGVHSEGCARPVAEEVFYQLR